MTTDIELMAQASAATGRLSDFGPDDGFRVALRLLLADVDRPAVPVGERERLLAEWQRRLEVRLRLVALRAERPDIAAQRIERPLIVTGLPRTGTTSLFDILAQDPAVRAPLTWETMTLGVPAEPCHWHDDPRIAEIDAILAGLDDPVATSGLHTYGARLPDECNNLHLYNFWGARYPGEPEALFLPRASEWIENCMPAQPYTLHRMILQHLQAHGPGGRWILKEPFHIIALDEIVREYPDAMLVQTHRDPIGVFTSVVGLIATIRRQGPGDPGRAATGRYVLRHWGAALRRCLAARCDPALDERILDIGQKQIVRAPMETVRAIYDRFGLELGAEAERRMTQWIANPAQHESKTRFSLADFDLTEADVEREIGAYRERFGRYF